MLAYMFPGQGSQRRGMGQELFDSVPIYRTLESEVDSLAGYSLRERCLVDPGNLLRLTQYTQPCLYTVNCLQFLRDKQQGAAPAYVAGHSLGEYSALFAAGVFDFLTGLRLVIRRGELMARASDGAMAAIVGLTSESIEGILKQSALTSIDIANLNSPQQIVISGPTEHIKRAMALLEQAGAVMCIPLPVSAAFHSRYMREAALSFDAYLAQFNFQSPLVPVVSNVTAQPYPDDAAGIRALLTKQVTNPVRWVDCIRFLQSKGVTRFEEVGPGTVLSGLLKQIAGKHAA